MALAIPSSRCQTRHPVRLRSVPGAPPSPPGTYLGSWCPLPGGSCSLRSVRPPLPGGGRGWGCSGWCPLQRARGAGGRGGQGAGDPGCSPPPPPQRLSHSLPPPLDSVPGRGGGRARSFLPGMRTGGRGEGGGGEAGRESAALGIPFPASSAARSGRRGCARRTGRARKPGPGPGPLGCREVPARRSGRRSAQESLGRPPRLARPVALLRASRNKPLALPESFSRLPVAKGVDGGQQARNPGTGRGGGGGSPCLCLL